ncbi:MAG: ABC transporter permease subunit [Kiritimatiellae bacterium]|nr:ABC transporter permease subunit [Kiritimatiellia bacterium]
MQNRLHYFIVRLCLVGVSFLGIVLVCFLFTNIVPGGPVEQYVANMQAAGGETAAGGSELASRAMSEEQLEAIREAFGLNLPFHERFWKWLVTDRIGMRAHSFKYTNKTAWEMISERFPVSLSFGIPSLVLTYLICIPLGIAKALRNGKPFDLVSSFVVFTLYAIPAFAFGMLLKMLFSGTVEQFWDIFPLGGFRSSPEIWETLSLWEKIKDQLWHMALPVFCYVMGNFAVMTLLMKNSLLEQINQDYVRTVLAKGGTMKRAVWRHAVRNALIPLATGIGGILSVMFAGSVLIEQVFDIPGIGWLSLDAVTGRDYPLFLAIVSIQSILGLLGLVLSDFCYVLIDPRIHFGGDR